MTHYLYEMHDPEGRVRYVGCTKDPWKREVVHNTWCDTAAFFNTTDVLTLKIVAILQTKNEGHRVERAWLDVLRRRDAPLLNKDRRWRDDDPRRGRPKAPSSTRAESVRRAWKRGDFATRKSNL